MYELTPVEEAGGLLFKREDKYRPYGANDVNGGKLRQCHALLHSVMPKSVVTACSIHSPQGPITAAVCEEMNIPCHIFFGGTNEESLRNTPMPKLAAKHGAIIHIAAMTARHNVLYKRARNFADENGSFVVEYGFNVTQHPEIMYGAISKQVQNIPDVERICLTCGSGITSCGVIRGIEEHSKRLKELHLFATAPSRERLIESVTGSHSFKIIFHDMFHDHGFRYEDRKPLNFAGINLHPNYEAKSIRRMAKDKVPTEGTLFWIVGAEPKTSFS